MAQLNRIVFSVFLPVMVFQNIYSAELGTAFDGTLLLYLVVFIFLAWGGLMLLAPRWLLDRRKRGAFIQATIRSNTIIFGMPILNELFGGQDLGGPTIITAAVTVGFNIIGVVTLEVFRGGRLQPKQIFRNVAKNPIVLASAAAIFCLTFAIRLPSFAEKTTEAISAMASPMGLFLIGACIHLNLRTDFGVMAVSLILRLLGLPAIGLLGAIAFGWRGMDLCTVLAVVATPTSVSAYSMAQAMDSDGELSAMLVGIGSILATGTLFFWLAVLKLLRFF